MARLEVLGCGDVEPWASTEAAGSQSASPRLIDWKFSFGCPLMKRLVVAAVRDGQVRCRAIKHQAFTSQDLNEDAIEMYAMIHCTIMLKIALLKSIATVSDAGSSNSFAPHSMHAVSVLSGYVFDVP
jgi:hypothetical protein